MMSMMIVSPKVHFCIFILLVALQQLSFGIPASIAEGRDEEAEGPDEDDVGLNLDSKGLYEDEENISERMEEIYFEYSPIVRTTLGAVRGNRLSIPDFNKTVDVFWRIPFALPPVGELRFRPPEAAVPWSGVLDGTLVPNACHQYKSAPTLYDIRSNVSEDCLYLNVFVPRLTSKEFAYKKDNNDHDEGSPSENMNSTCTQGMSAGGASLELRPVMVFLHGGGLIRGSSGVERYNATLLAAVNDVLVISFNYRLGVFGFLYAGNDEAPGNAGLLDQVMALKWIRSNVACFGGDPESITVFGGSAGAASVGFLIFSPLADGLFHRAILASGPPLDFPIGYDKTPHAHIDRLLRLAQLANCQAGPISTSTRPFTESSAHDEERPVKMATMTNATSTHHLSQDVILSAVRCLKNLTDVSLDAAQEALGDARYKPLLVQPFFPAAAVNRSGLAYEEVLAKKNFSVLLGVTKQDGTLFLAERHAKLVGIMKDKEASLSLRQFLVVVNSEIDRNFQLTPQQKLTVFHSYINWEDPHNGISNLKKAGDLLTDIMFKCPTNEFGRQLADRGIRVYYFVLAHRSSQSKLPRWGGATHGSEAEYLFGHPFRYPGYTEEEKNLSQRFMKHYGNFAKCGNPSLGDLEWPLYRKHQACYVELEANTTEVKKGPRARECALWNLVIPKMAELGCRSNVSSNKIEMNFGGGASGMG